ncbi:MAG TPA: KEOPS complex N(6)-L-threonylcarbamoyladenine synthase Kae1 [archaeon]|nr:KEOPS complex N(6)-L-threonylcarbamoyladenine synthase Kae1 [archaeon]
MFVPETGKGIIPRDAANHHSEVCHTILKRVLEKSSIKLSEIDVFAYSRGPGLPPCLKVGAVFARTLAIKYNKPLMDVNHPVAHIEIGKLTTGTKDPVVLYVSGGNTQILAFASGRYRTFGETLDIPIGNALDQLARTAGLPNPGGPNIEKAAVGGKYVELPYVVKGMDLSFAGIVTAAEKLLKNGASVNDVCFSMQETCFAMLLEVTERALAHTGKKEAIIVGGVAANKRFKNMLDIMCKERGAEAFAVPIEYSMDNGTMIAWTGMLQFKSGWKDSKKMKIDPNWRGDETDITWMQSL